MKYLLLLLILVGCSTQEQRDNERDLWFYQHVYHFCETITNEGHPERAPGLQFVKCLRSWGY